MDTQSKKRIPRDVGAKTKASPMTRQELMVMSQYLADLAVELRTCVETMDDNGIDVIPEATMKTQRERSIAALKNFIDDTRDAVRWEMAQPK